MLNINACHANLIASLLTATREMFIRTSFIGSGYINEIVMAENTLLLEGGDNIVVIAIVTVVHDEMRKFTKSLANEIEEKYAGTIQSWFGDYDSIQGMVDTINKRVQEEIVNK